MVMMQNWPRLGPLSEGTSERAELFYFLPHGSNKSIIYGRTVYNYYGGFFHNLWTYCSISIEIFCYKIVHFLVHNYGVLVANYKLPFSLPCPSCSCLFLVPLSRAPLFLFSLPRLPFIKYTSQKEGGKGEKGDLHAYKGRE